jgi:hypothetical protein
MTLLGRGKRMALITCEDCGKSISDRAPSCPHCGAPGAAVSTKMDHIPITHPTQAAIAPTKSRPGLTIFLSVVAVIALIILIAGSPTTTPTVQPKAAPSPQQVKAQSSYIDYELLARSPTSYQGRLVYFQGKVIQATQSGLSYVLRVNVSRGKYDGWSNTIYVDYRASSAAYPRILEGDIINLWGDFVGIKSYTAVLGQSIQIPHLEARVIETAGSDNPAPKADPVRQAWSGSIEDADAAYNRGDYSTAIKMYRALAAHGNPKAQLNIGLMYVKGQGADRDIRIAQTWFNSAAINPASDLATRDDATYNRDLIAKNLAK